MPSMKVSTTLSSMLAWNSLGTIHPEGSLRNRHSLTKLKDMIVEKGTPAGSDYKWCMNRSSANMAWLPLLPQRWALRGSNAANLSRKPSSF